MIGSRGEECGRRMKGRKYGKIAGCDGHSRLFASAITQHAARSTRNREPFILTAYLTEGRGKTCGLNIIA